MRRSLQVGIVIVLGCLVATPALAGGSWLEPSSGRVEPGEQVRLEGSVSIGQLGWVDDGPFFAYLSGEGITEIQAGLGGVETDVPLGPVEISDVTDFGAVVSVEFTIPDSLTPGEYWVSVCNDPCTTGFGDLIGTQLFVGVEPFFDEPTVAAIAPDARTTNEAAPTSAAGAEDDESPVTGMATDVRVTGDEGSDPVLVGAGVVVGLVLIGGVVRMRRSDAPAAASEVV